MKHNRFWMSAALLGALACDGFDVDPVQVTDIQPARVGREDSLAAAAGFHSERAGYRAGNVFVDDGVIRLAGAPVELATASIARGATELGTQVRATALAGSGELTLDRGAATEMLESREDGLEQSWRFESEPDGAGDLVVQVAVAGARVVSTDDDGLALGAVHYSNAIWLDAAGAELDLPVTWQAGRIAIRVPEALLASSQYPAVLDPIISIETRVDSVTADGYTGAWAREPSLAWSGSRYLVAWRDDRLGRDSDIYVARVESDGAVVDPRGILVSNASLVQSEPAVVWTGSTWLVAWTHDGGTIAAATVSPTGVVAQLGNVAATAAAESDPALASDGASAYLVWQSDGDVSGARYSSGAFEPAVAIAATADLEGEPTVAGATGGGYLVAWQAGASGAEDVRGQLVDATGALAGAAFPISATAGSQTAPAAAWDGSEFVVAYKHKSDIWGAAVASDGVVGTPAAISATPTMEKSPAIACDDASCLVTWQDRRDTVNLTYGVYGRQLGGALAPLGDTFTVSDPIRNQIVPQAAAAATGFMLVWEDVRTGVPTVTLSPVDGAGDVLEPTGVVVNRSARNMQQAPAVARHAGGQLVVWSDSRNLGDDIMARRYDSAGTRLDTGALVVSSAQYDQTSPAVSHDGTSYVVVWSDARNNSRYDIYGARFAQDGTLLDPAGFAVSNAPQHQIFPDVASGAGVSLAVWQDRSNRSDFDLRGAIIQDGAVIATEIPICVAAGDQRRAAVAFDPASSQFVVAWADTRAAGDENIYAARVATDGSVLDDCGVLVSGAPGQQFKPAIAASGGQLLVTWDDRRTDASSDVWGARLDATAGLSVIDPLGIALATGSGSQSASTLVGIKGGRWALAWADGRDEVSTASDIYGNTVLASGALEGAEYLISGGTDAETAPSFESDTNATAKVYLVYERTRLDLGTTRAVRRRLTF